MLIHHYSPATGEYLNSGQPDADPRNDGRWLVPSSATHDAPPPRTPTTWPFYLDGAWTLLPDCRGRVFYRTDNGEAMEITIAGKTPEDLGLTTDPRPSLRHVWIDGAWAIPADVMEREKRDAAMAEFNRLMETAREANVGRADAYAAGLLDDDGVYYFKAWSAYQMALVAAIHAPRFPNVVQWPDVPALYEPPAIAQATPDKMGPVGPS